MGALILISGSNSSGKSIFAEELVGRTVGERFYIATMVPQTEDNLHRIEKHRRQREELHFVTLEIPYQVRNAPVTPESMVLLEDASNLLANTVFEYGGNGDEVYRDIRSLADRCKVLMVVTISGLRSEDYDGETAAYINCLEELNRRLYEAADTAIVLKDGIADCQKGDLNAFT